LWSPGKHLSPDSTRYQHFMPQLPEQCRLSTTEQDNQR
jgi:hypothetical protein